MKQALLLLNMGGPTSLDEVELFLRNMFSDRRILPMNPLMRKFVGSIIVAKRKDEAKENYRLLGGKSPLLEITESLAKKLQLILQMPVFPTMRYVPPFSKSVLERCKAEQIERLILFPMYPQYSTTTTLSSLDAVMQACEALSYNPKIDLVKAYYDDIDYLEMIVERIAEALGEQESQAYDLLLSAHGLPLKIVRSGDPYETHVQANVSALKVLLAKKGLHFHDIKTLYQSKVGKGKWLEPNLIDVLRNPTHKKVLIYPLSFTIDNSETLFELDIEHREIATKLGYEDYRVARCFNDSDRFVEFIANKVRSLEA